MCAGCYMLNLKLDIIAREKAVLLELLNDDEIDKITPEALVEVVEG